MASYATPAQLVAFHDVRDIGDLLADDGTRVAAGSIAANANVLAALERASGEIEASVLVGNRYTPAELTTLTGNSLAYLVGITCDIAMAYLYSRRHMPGTAWAEKRKGVEELAFSHLERLAKGAAVFNLEPQKDKGNPTIGGPSTASTLNLNLIRYRTQRFYPQNINPSGR